MLVETTIDLAIEGELFLRVKEKMDSEDKSGSDSTTRRMPVYLAIFALAQYVSPFSLRCLSAYGPCSVFQFAMALDAVYARNTLQFILLALV